MTAERRDGYVQLKESVEGLVKGHVSFAEQLRADREASLELTREVVKATTSIGHLNDGVTSLSSDIKELTVRTLKAQHDASEAKKAVASTDENMQKITELVVRHDQDLTKKKRPTAMLATGAAVVILFLMFNYNPGAASSTIDAVKSLIGVTPTQDVQ